MINESEMSIEQLIEEEQRKEKERLNIVLRHIQAGVKFAVSYTHLSILLAKIKRDSPF